MSTKDKILLKTATNKQKNVYNLLKKYYLVNGFFPTYKEIQNYLNLNNVSVINKYIHALINKGYIEQVEGRRTQYIFTK